jgi:hypothetical protein
MFLIWQLHVPNVKHLTLDCYQADYSDLEDSSHRQYLEG